MEPLINQILRGHKGRYQILEPLKKGPVFKTGGIFSSCTEIPRRRVISQLDTAEVVSEDKKQHSDSPPLRGMILEWMDTDLRRCLVSRRGYGPLASHQTDLRALDKFIDEIAEAWCIAKIKRLVGPLGPPVKPEFEEEFAVADFLESETFQLPESPEPAPFIRSCKDPRSQAVASRGNECIDFIESLQVIDHAKRPSASDALNHRFITSHSARTLS